MTIRHDKKERAGGAGTVAETRIGEGVERRPGGGRKGDGGRMGTQKGRVDVQQQPPSLLQTPQLPGAAPARPEVTRLLPTTRLRLTLPLSISLLPPSFARVFSLFLPVVSLFLLLIITRCRLAHPSTVIYMRTHSGDDARLLSRPLFFFSSRLTPRGNACGARFASGGSESRGSLPRYETAEEKCDVATPTSTPTTTSRHTR